MISRGNLVLRDNCGEDDGALVRISPCQKVKPQKYPKDSLSEKSVKGCFPLSRFSHARVRT